MKKIIVLLFALGILFQVNGQGLSPYILGATSSKSVSELKTTVSSALSAQGLNVVGSYMPAADKNRLVIIVTHDQLTKAVQQIGELTGFAATLRVAITREESVTNVSYTNPVYWGNAYFREDFSKVKANYDAIAKSFDAAMKASGTYKGTPFGSKKGEEAEGLHKYHYMIGMPYFDDTNELKEFESYEEAVAKIDANLKKGVPNAKLVYKYEVPGKKLTLYGIALYGEDGEGKFLPKIDITSPKHTAFLPYEILVMDDEVHMLHGRFRIAIAFPDLTMGTFTKIMSTPGEIEDMLEKVVE
ncbi:MAG: hypothetical protein L3J29_06810 [Cyclobacteriaceae bacterium]|nr:hypothetical protein [Cyclobacteriaceae bacterium]